MTTKQSSRLCATDAHVESVNGRFRDECLNDNWFLTLHESTFPDRGMGKDYNSARPHSSLGNITPADLRPNTNLQPKILLPPVANYAEQVKRISIWLSTVDNSDGIFDGENYGHNISCLSACDGVH